MGNPNCLMLVTKNSGNNSVLLRFVELVIGRSGWIRELIDQQFRVLIGDGHDPDFWKMIGQVRGAFRYI